MNYFEETLQESKDHHYHQFYLSQTQSQIDSMYFMDYRKDELHHMAQEMIFKQ